MRTIRGDIYPNLVVLTVFVCFCFLINFIFEYTLPFRGLWSVRFNVFETLVCNVYSKLTKAEFI